MERSFVFLAAFILFLALIFGCASFGSGEKPTISEGAGQQTNGSQDGAGQGEALQNENDAVEEPVALQNESSGADIPLDPFVSYAPRNASDRMGEGQFRLPDQSDNTLEISVIDAGNADAVLVRKGNFTILVDAGDFEKVDARLRAMGIGRLDVVVATRDAQDAVGGMAQALGGYRVGELWDNGLPASSHGYETAMRLAEEKGITIKRPQAGESLEAFGIRLDVLNPQKVRLKGSPESDAVVLKISQGEFCLLLLNPTVQEIEGSLMNSGVDVRCPVITYFMHGEGRPTPSLLVERSNPKDVIISVGQNSNGLPSETTITRLEIGGKSVWRTDRHGTLTVSVDKDGSYTVTPEK